MNTNWLIVAATAAEIQPFTAYLTEKATRRDEMHYIFGDKNITILITGVGLTQTAYHLGAVLARQSFDWVVNAGIAGAIKRDLAIGEVVEVSSECFGDTGAETATGSFIDIHEMGLIPPDVPPFLGGELISPYAGAAGLPLVKGLSVNKVHGYLPSITEMMIHYDADIETMEGAAFFYACLSAGQPFKQIRSLSNYVEPRDRSKWNIPLAVQAVNAKLIELLQQAQP
jgi:futalosine hydrolase